MKNKSNLKPTKTHGRNPLLGNSLISLGSHGGLLYKNAGPKDNYGLYRQSRINESPNYVWKNLKIKTYYYQKESTVLKKDKLFLKTPHYCGSRYCFIKQLKNSTVTIQCEKCKSTQQIPYSKFQALYYKAARRVQLVE